MEFIYQRRVNVSANDLGKFLLLAISLGIKGLNAFKGVQETKPPTFTGDSKLAITEKTNPDRQTQSNGLKVEDPVDASNAVSIQETISGL